MESLLSVSFDNIASRDLAKTRKGLRQVEGLLAQLCLSPGTSSSTQTPARRRRSSTLSRHDQIDDSGSLLSNLSGDLAFLEFFRLQESFEWNVAIRLIECLERLLGLRSCSQTNELIVSTLDLIHGMLLLHPRSRALFSRETHMTLLLDLLDPQNPASVLSSAITSLLSALLDSVRNIRLFEAMDGIPTLASLFHSHGIEQAVRIRLMEVFSFYAMPEVGTFGAPKTAASGGTADTTMINTDISVVSVEDGGTPGSPTGKRQNSSVKSHQRSSSSTSNAVPIKSAEEKQAILEQYLQHMHPHNQSQVNLAAGHFHANGHVKEHYEDSPLRPALLV